MVDGPSFFTSLLFNATTRITHTNNPFLFLSQFLPLDFLSLLFLQNHPYHLHQHSLYTSAIFHLLIFTCSHPYKPHQKFSPLPLSFSRFRLCQAPSERDSVVRTDTFNLCLLPRTFHSDGSAHSHQFFITKTQSTIITSITHLYNHKTSPTPGNKLYNSSNCHPKFSIFTY